MKVKYLRHIRCEPFNLKQNKNNSRTGFISCPFYIDKKSNERNDVIEVN